jgi:hypothetical protein
VRQRCDIQRAHAVLLRPSASDAHRLVAVFERNTTSGNDTSSPRISQRKATLTPFARMGPAIRGFTLTENRPGGASASGRVRSGIFDVFGVGPASAAAFLRKTNRARRAWRCSATACGSAGSAPTAGFSARRSAQRKPYTVIGVLPADFSPGVLARCGDLGAARSGPERRKQEGTVPARVKPAPLCDS